MALTGGQPRVLFWGMLNSFALPPLAALLAGGVEIAAIIISASELPEGRSLGPVSLLPPERSESTLPLVNSYVNKNILHLAWERGIPAYAIERASQPDVLQLIDQLAPDVACVACFPQRIPAPLLARPAAGFLNIHPSRLPMFRGPAPLFWVFRQGVQDDTGVTVHKMDEGLDTGAIVNQASISFADGISGPEAEYRCAVLGGQLLAAALEDLGKGALRSRPQPAGGQYFPWPEATDFALRPDWPARRAFNFMRGTADWQQPYRIEVEGAALQLGQALAYEPGGRLPAAVVQEDGTLFIQFSPGILQVRPY